jgi:hypothetical protein
MAAASPNARLVRAGQQFMFARDRRVALPPGESLTAAARGLDLPALRALINCEISFGEIEPGGWIITRSSLPWRVGATLKLRRLDFVEGDKAAPPPNPD